MKRSLGWVSAVAGACLAAACSFGSAHSSVSDADNGVGATGEAGAIPPDDGAAPSGDDGTPSDSVTPAAEGDDDSGNGVGATGEASVAPGIALFKSSLTRDEEPALDENQVALGKEGTLNFAFRLHAEVGASEADNFVVSAYSVRRALAMLYAGAESDTKVEMRSALSFELEEPALHAAFNAADLALASRNTTSTADADGTLGLSSVNALFPQRGLEIVPAFLDTLAVNYDAGLFVTDFASDAETARTSINRWVGEQTSGRVAELLPPQSIEPRTKLVLVNAVHFFGSWQVQFDPGDTRQGVFHAPSGDVDVPTMHGTSLWWYMREEGVQALDLPYVGADLSMLLVLPDSGHFGEFEAGFDANAFRRIRDALVGYEVSVTLPRFSFSTSLEVKEVMQVLGMRLAFDELADFSGIAGGPGDLLVDQIYHQSFIAVDEEGTEAAAATAVVLLPDGGLSPAEFVADRPFIFVIYDQPTEEILFTGRVVNPDL